MNHKVTIAIVTASFLATACASTAMVPVADNPAAEQLVKTAKSWNGDPLPSYPDTPPEITMLRIIIPPGSQLPTHTHPVINAGYLVSGELVVHTHEGETTHLAAGDPIVELVNKPHYGSNPGTEPAVIVVFYAGTAGTPLTVVEE